LLAIFFAAIVGGCTWQPMHTATPSEVIELGGANIRITYQGQTNLLDHAQVRQWIADSATAVQTYYGRFPVQRVHIVIDAVEGRGAQSGTTFAYDGALIRVGVGRFSSAADLKRDWIMTHEMVHLSLPKFVEAHVWLEEGMATYVEPIARTQAGQLSDETLWGDMVDGMPKGLPEANDQGLDNTHTWGRTYWGGALFYLLADVRIRERTANRFGLQDALRGILNAGGSNEVSWDVRRALTTGDQATGAKVLTELYDEMRAQAVAPDLAMLWKSLGVNRTARGVDFDDAAPLAAIRRAISHIRSASDR
jgi:predicted metalloprotease with PDZ domain